MRQNVNRVIPPAPALELAFCCAQRERLDLKVQQELLRHADIRTTMNIYTQAVPEDLREANSKLVEMVLPAAVGV